jgi:hypothetical protein
MKKHPYLLAAFCVISVSGFCQVYSNKEVGKKNAALIDSIKAKEYPYALPIWGQKVTERGYDLPYSAGLNINYLWQESKLVLNNLNVGFNNGQMINLDEIVRFNDATATANAVNFRPDIWLLPFLNVYGILGVAKTSTAIDAGIWVPGKDNEFSEVARFSTKANFDATVMGFGVTPTMGVGGGWIALDMNVAWTDVSALDKPVFTFVVGPRFGKTFKFKKPERNIAIWVGGFRVQFSSATNGSINLTELVPTDVLQGKVDAGISNVAAKQVAVDNWWAGLSNIEQNNPVNEAKYELANRTLNKAGNFFASMDAALNDGQAATIQYSLDKNLKDKWNFIVGSQFQLNKHFMIRAEYGFLGSRNQFLGGVQYRFGL